ncbi:hypothetical protein D3C81_2240490 [compost metagenome]
MEGQVDRVAHLLFLRLGRQGLTLGNRLVEVRLKRCTELAGGGVELHQVVVGRQHLSAAQSEQQGAGEG